MTGPRSKRKPEESRPSDPTAQPNPKASRQSRPVGAAAPPLECEAPAVWIARPSSPVFTKETMHLNLAHILRSGRKIYVPNTSKPAPLQYKKGEEPIYDVSWHTPVCAKVALEHYNRLNEEDEHELVKAVDSIAFFFNGRWMHANFLAKSKGAKNCVDLVPKYFFAELKVGPDGNESCVSCTKMDPANPETRPVRGCKICPSRMFHPVAGGHRGVPVLHRAARGDQVKTQAAPDVTA